MTEAIEELERYKSDMVVRLRTLITKQALLMLASVKKWFSEMKIVEQTSLDEFQGLLD